MINWTELPKWLNEKMWSEALTASGLNGTYFLEFDDDGYIRNSRLIDPKGTWGPTTRFRESFRLRHEFNNPNTSQSAIKFNISDALNYSLEGYENQWDTGDHEYLWHYEPSELAYMGSHIVLSVYHYNDDMAKSEGDKNLNCVIYNVTVERGDRIPNWNTKATMPIEVLFG